jgi:CRISPR-associated protein (TIGR03986 family)
MSGPTTDGPDRINSLELKEPSTFDRRVLVLAARQGLDGQGLFGAEFGTGRSRGYTRVLILDPPNPVRLTLSQEIQEHYRRTLEHLRDNEHGHLRKHPKAPDQRNARRHIKAMLDSCFPADTAFFLEVRGNKILSIGHHFRYRWRYRDTVRTVNMQERVEVKPLEDERETDNEGKPRHLAPNRSLFGYVSTERAERHENEPATAGIGEGDFKQLAGRIAFNFAVEQITKKKTGQPKSLAGRFLNADAGCFVALKVLGSPKPSACEHYLEQSQFSKRKDNGVYCSYGDTLDDPVEASLAGRKFYLHQRRGKWNWQPGQTEDRQGKSRFSDLSALARYVLKDGSRLRCRLRFINLRPWELGALLIALELRADEVDRFVEEIDKSSDGWTWHLEQAQANGTDKKPRYAHKLGHARPLGLGSVVFQADALRIFDRNAEWVEVDQRQRATYVEAFAKRLKDHGQMDAWFSSVFVPFCEVHRFSGVKREALNYPTAHDKRNGETIVKYHSTLRGNHIKGRQQAKNGQREPSGLPRLVALEPQR